MQNTLIIGEIHMNAKQLLSEKTLVTEITEEDFKNKYELLDTQIVVIRAFTKIGKEELDKLPDLTHLVSCSVGIDNIETDLLKQRGIELIHIQGTNANSVAEHTLYLILSLIRNKKPPFFELKNKTIGIVGFGNIGKILAKKLLGFDVKVIAYDVIKQDEEILNELGVEMKDMKYIGSKSDIITIHVPLNKHTENMINEEFFQNMKQGSFFVNTSRAEIIDEESLLKNIKSGKFRGLGLDVCSLTLKKQLSDLKEYNIILTEHVAAQGEDSFREMCLIPVKELIKRI